MSKPSDWELLRHSDLHMHNVHNHPQPPWSWVLGVRTLALAVCGLLGALRSFTSWENFHVLREACPKACQFSNLRIESLKSRGSMQWPYFHPCAPNTHAWDSCLPQMIVIDMSFGRPRFFFSGGAVPLVPCQLASSRIREQGTEGAS